MKSDRSKRCWTCGRPRGLEQQRRSWGIHPTPDIPRTDNPDDKPAQISNDLICSVAVYRNGGTHEETHLCNECLRIGVRVLKLRLSELLGELDADHDKDAEIAALTKRLAALQHRHHNVCFDHDRMQGRLADLLKYVVAGAPAEVVEMAQWEAKRGPAKGSVDALPVEEVGEGAVEEEGEGA